MKRISKALLFLLILTIVSACSTQKKRGGEVSKLSKFYHNVTAEFNGYFNANVLYTESVNKLNTEHQDNYNKILSVYKYVDAENPKSVADDLDNAIKKLSIVISLHRVSDWTDDSYLLIGQSQYVKQDYESAEETLEYLAEEYSPEAMAKRKKNSKKKKKRKKKSKKKKKKTKKKSKKSNDKKRKEANKKLKKKKKKKSRRKGKKKKSSSKKDDTKVEKPTKKTKKEDTPPPAPKKEEEKKKEDEDKPDNYFMKHRPAYQECQLWLARTYIERQNYDEAAAILSKLDRDPKTFKDVRRQLAPAQAHFFMRQKQYESAIAPLERAIETANKRQNKARYCFILAQIHQEAKRGEQAYAYFEKAKKYSNAYDMEFRAKLNMAQNGWLNGKTTAEQTIKNLKKMLKDKKNVEFKDQIYYAMADISLKNNNKNDAIAYLKQSLSHSNSNRSQRVESYMLLADLYYENQDFVNAKSYFDSTLQVMAKTDDRYTRVSRFSNNLGDIAANILLIQEKDSLLAISRLSEEDKLALAYKIKKQQDEERIRALTAKANKAGGRDKFGGARSATATTVSRGSASSPSTFFAYNQRSARRGKRDFDKRWRFRKLEDNWRRSNRGGIGNIDDEIVDEAVPEGAITEDDVKKILEDVPSTPEEIKSIEDAIADAMFILGTLYRDRLELNEKSVETLENLDKRFPGHKHELDAWYFLYLAHTDLGNTSRAKYYFDKIIQKYPDTTYASILKDPNFLENNKKEEQRLTNYYNETYDNFKKENYQNALDRISKAPGLFGADNELQPRFALLRAMCLGNVEGKEAYKKELQEVITKYKDTPEQKRAREILRLLGGKDITADDRDKVGGEALKDGSESPFKVEDKKLHYFVVALNGSTIKLTDAKAAVSDYNRQYHKLDKLRISNVYLGADTNTPILVIRRFKNKDKAMSYLNGIRSNSGDFLPDGTEYEMYPITQYNYRQILKNKSLDGYREFFEENY